LAERVMTWRGSRVSPGSIERNSRGSGRCLFGDRGRGRVS